MGRLQELHEMQVFLPDDLARVAAGQLRLISENQESNQLQCQFRRAVKVSIDAQDFAERANPPLFASRMRDASGLAEADTVSASVFRKLCSQYASQLGLSDLEFENSGRRYKIRTAPGAAGSIDRITQLAQAGVKLNATLKLNYAQAGISTPPYDPRRQV